MNNKLRSADDVDPVLAALQRANLRAGVDKAALEIFLRAAPEYVAAAIMHFSESIEPADALESMRQHGASQEELLAFQQAMTPEDEDEFMLVRFAFDPPLAAPLRSLWDAIEPGESGSPHVECSS